MNNKTEKLYNVLVVDDHVLVRTGIISILKEYKNINEIYEAGTGEEALTLIAEHKPDLVLVDISLPDFTGIEVISRAMHIPGLEDTGVLYLVISIYNSPEYIYRAFKAGANGMVSKSCSPGELFEAVSKVISGERFLSPNVSTLPLEEILRIFEQKNFQNYDAETVYLTLKEREVLVLVYRGMQNKQIAEKLCISERTVESHRSMILKKLNAKSIMELNHIISNSDKLTKLVNSSN